MTGKGDRWGRDRLGWSAPAFMAASTPALPPLTCTAKGRHRWSAAVFLLRSRPAVGRSVLEACAGRKIRRLCLPAVPVLRAVCLLFTLCLPCPLPFTSSCPRSVCFAPFKFCFVCAPVHCHARQDRSGPAVCRRVRASSLQAARLSRWQLQHGPAVAARATVHLLTPSFPCRVHDPGPWV